jgi:predicted 3-demethylubiquinone-9 3-methyltransferase (glyoxalase superfamily)
VAIQKISPFLWFDHQAEEAAAFYVAIFPKKKLDIRALQQAGEKP